MYIINRIRHLSRATLTPYRPILAVSNIDRSIFILYCMAMRGIPEYIAQARTILHASVGQVQYGPSAGKIFWCPPNIKPCNIIIIIYKNRHFYFNYRGCGQILLSIDTVSKMYQCWFDEIFLTLQATCYGCDYYVTIDNVSWM